MDALFALEVQFFVRRPGKLIKDATETGERQTDSSLGGKSSLGPTIGARNSAEFSKPQILLRDREFESRLVRQQLSF
jgi:hypothetical protein